MGETAATRQADLAIAGALPNPVSRAGCARQQEKSRWPQALPQEPDGFEEQERWASVISRPLSLPAQSLVDGIKRATDVRLSDSGAGGGV